MTTPALDKPLTGEEYLESLRDGREVWIGGEKVADVTEHPAFRNATRSVARLYDALHDPANDMLTTDRRGIRTHKFFAPAYSSQDLVDAREALAIWSRMSYGFMGRSPDYKASFMAGLGADPDWYGPFSGSAEHWYRKYARERAVPQPRAHQPADRPLQARARHGGRLRARREGARRRHGRQRREDARDRLRAHARDVRRAEQRDAAREGQGRGLRARLHRPARHARPEAAVPPLLRGDRGLAVRPPALQPIRRERRGASSSTTRSSRGRTCSSTATSRRRPASTRSRGS